ncbi:MAG: orotate phosphoribosyltransferase [Robiginitomaculum sp.]|nr:orotate phosphoribosyltransferase [Robiginitomaculum sp.]MDQ7078242.1 orotate phosphoribosyltransferase [Robiginitomaculum sp.]
MNTNDVLQVFRDAGALLEGHFVLSSGRHSPFFLQKAFVFMDPDSTETLCKALAEKVAEADLGPLDAIVSPAVGGIIPGYETARHMKLPAMYVERDEGQFCLRRGFSLKSGARVLIVEDIVTTGLSSRECIEAVRALGADVVAEACLIDRSGGKADVGAPLIALAQVDFPTYAADDLPPELAALPPHKPGSRDLHA